MSLVSGPCQQRLAKFPISFLPGFGHTLRVTQRAIALSIVVPVFNESEGLPALFRELDRVRNGSLRECGPIEIVLVDDGSKDSELGTESPRNASGIRLMWA